MKNPTGACKLPGLPEKMEIHLGQAGLDAAGLGGDGEQRGDAEGDARRNRLDVQPERHPRDDDHQHRGQVALHHVVADGALHVELGHQATVLA